MTTFFCNGRGRRLLGLAACLFVGCVLWDGGYHVDAAHDPSNPSHVFLSGYPAAHQRHPLTCEAAATSMATKGVVSENSIIARTPFNEDPNLGYRGNPNGSYIIPGLPNYGVYPKPIAKVLSGFGWTTVPIYGASKYGLKRYLSFGWPVVVWITFELSYEAPFWMRNDGHIFPMVPDEHAVTAIGYTRKGVIVDDPYTGVRAHYDWQDFLRSWGYLHRMALAVRPCKTPSPVTDIHGQRSLWTIDWTWRADPGVRRYRVWVFHRLGGEWSLIRHLETKQTTFTARGTVAGDGYLVRVEGIKPCGVTGPARYGYSPGT